MSGYRGYYYRAPLRFPSAEWEPRPRLRARQWWDCFCSTNSLLQRQQHDNELADPEWQSFLRYVRSLGEAAPSATRRDIYENRDDGCRTCDFPCVLQLLERPKFALPSNGLRCPEFVQLVAGFRGRRVGVSWLSPRQSRRATLPLYTVSPARQSVPAEN